MKPLSSVGRGSVISILICALAAGVAGVAVGVASAQGSETVNESGQTVGRIDGLTPSTYPDLIQVRATNGKLGFVLSAQWNELTGASVSTPAEAVAWQEQMDAEGWTVREIPVYESDGITQIGVFPITRTQGHPPVDGLEGR